MGNTLITMIVEDKQAMLEGLISMQNAGLEYSKRCLEVLRSKYKVDIERIDQKEFSYGPVGYILDCQALGNKPKHPEQYLDEILSHYSDYGLMRCGLTRRQYEQGRTANNALAADPKPRLSVGIVPATEG